MVATDPVDARLLAAVAELGRAAVHDVAARVGMDPREVASRLIALSANGLPLLVGVECDPNGIRAGLASAGWPPGGPPNPAQPNPAQPNQAPPGPGQPGAQQPGPGQAGPVQAGPGQAGPVQAGRVQAGPGQAAPGQAGPPPSFPGQGPHGHPSGPYSVHGTPSGPYAVPGGHQTQAGRSGPYPLPGPAQGVPSGGYPSHTGPSAAAAGYPATPGAPGQHSGPHNTGLNNPGTDNPALNNPALNNPAPNTPGLNNPGSNGAEPDHSGPHHTGVAERQAEPAFGVWGPPQVSFWARGDQQAAPDMESTRPAFDPARTGKVGQTLETVGLEGERLAIQLVELVDPADFLYTAAGYKLGDDERAVVVHTELTNHSGVPFPSLPDLYLVLVAEDGKTISKAPVALSSRPSYQIGVRPGETAGGHTVFVLSDTVRLREVRWSPQPGDEKRSLTWTIDD